MSHQKYFPRLADGLLHRKLQGMGAVLIEGPKWCGKSTTALQQAASEIRIDMPGQVNQYREAASLNPEILLRGDTPRLIDEWQIAPSLWDAVRFEVDRRQLDGQFILTGSAVPLSQKERSEINHSGTGRIGRIRMRTMSCWESKDSSGEVSLLDLFNGKLNNAICNLGLEDIAFIVCRGGWPRSITQPKEIALDRAFDYYDAVVNRDVDRIDGIQKNTERIKRIMRSYARLQGTQTSVNMICDDIAANDGATTDSRTVQNYLNALRAIFVVEDLPAWNPNLRSKTAIRTSETRYFTDASIATASLGLGPSDLTRDLRTFGFMFETMAIRDLRVYAESINGEVFHYRDSKGLECDAVVHLRNGQYGLIEIKLGGDILIEQGAENLLALSRKIDLERMKAPSFLMVLTANSPFAYKRSDGVLVVPIGVLKN